MEYPFTVKGAESADGGELTLFPPHPFMVEVASCLPTSSSVLDLGSHNGRNGLFLAELGHQVTSIDMNEGYINDGQRLARTIGGLALENNEFICQNMLDIDYDQEFDAVIATHSLYQILRLQLPDLINRMQRATKPGGLNIHRAYIGTPEEQAKVLPKTLLEPYELIDTYRSSGWRNKYTRTMPEPMQKNEETGQYFFSGAVELISQKPLPTSAAA